MVPVGGLEPPLPKEPDFESSVSTNFTTLACKWGGIITSFFVGSIDGGVLFNKVSKAGYRMIYFGGVRWDFPLILRPSG